MAEPWLTLILSFIGSIIPAFLFGFNGKRWYLVGLAGALGWATYLIASAFQWPSAWALFAAACVVALWNEGVTWVFRKPVPAVLIGGVFPLVPGLTSFQALEALLRRQDFVAGQKGGEALSAALAVALGVLVVAGFGRVLRTNMKRRT